MKTITPALLLLLLIGCARPSEKENDILRQRILRIENGLQPNLQIEGQEIPKYNIEERLQELGIPGLSIAVINQGRLEWAKGYGMADSSENRPVSSETLFLAGSISKPISALRALQLADEGIIHLDTNVNQYLSSWTLPDNEFTVAEKVSTRRILNHTAGLSIWGFPGYDRGDTIPTTQDILDGKGNTGPIRVFQTPGKAWQYSGGGYTLLQQLLTDVEQKTFPDLMQSAVLTPLGMTSSTFKNPLPAQYHQKAAIGYRRDGSEVNGKWHVYPEMAAAGLWTNPSELVLYAREIQQILQSGQDGLLQFNTVKNMLTAGMNDYGLGPAISEHTFGHNGADEGFRAELIAWKDEPIAMVIMVNSDNDQIIGELKLSIAQEYGLPGPEPIKRTLHPLSNQELQKFAGKFRIDGLGEVEMVVKDNGLEHRAPFAPEPIFLLPSSERTFFNTNGGAYLEYTLDGGLATGFKFYGFDAKRIE